MKVSLHPAIQKFIDEQVRAGRFASRAEVLEAGVARLMLDPRSDEFDAEDVAAVLQSEQQIARGETLDWKEVSARLRREYTENELRSRGPEAGG